MLSEVKHPDGLTRIELLLSKGIVVVTTLGFLISSGMTGAGFVFVTCILPLPIPAL
jgi:hypothetical protein